MTNLIYSLSPTITLLAQPDNLSLIRMVPLSVGETRIDEVLLVEPPVKGAAQWSQEELRTHETNFNLVNKVLNEDWALGETIQANMASGVVDEVHFGRFESALIWFHNEYEKIMGIETDALVTER